MSNALKSSPESAERTTLSAADWEQAALVLIAEKGLGSLGVEPLARRLEITKGSFYWHFSSRDELLLRALKRWEQQDAQHLAISLGGDLSPDQRLVEFVRRTSRQNLTHRVYAALCAAPEDPRVKRLLRRVTRRRIAYLAAVFSELGLATAAAAHRARLTYSAYMGYLQLDAQHLMPERETVEFDAYVEHVIRTLVVPDPRAR